MMSNRHGNDDKEEIVSYITSSTTDSSGWTYGTIEPVKMTKKEKAKWDNAFGVIYLVFLLAGIAFTVWAIFLR